ncbi:small multi-drug export protein [Candidatus Bathyarchaeota archaeon]|nr:small multi-drug export protein [Candidatus Bathyarchaeota archaeon]MBS7628796.1 small multi-drug export protein [Candidatus Bathyarchaeota archaeon]
MSRSESRLSKLRLKFYEARQEMAMLRSALGEAFSEDIDAARAFLAKHPFRSVGLAFLAGIIFGGFLQARVSIFTVLSVVGGFPLAIVYGHSQGLPTLFSIGLVVMIDSLVAYSLLTLMKVLDEYPRLKPILSRFKLRYAEDTVLFKTYSGRLGVAGALAACTFLIGWWIATVIAYLLDLDVRTTMVSVLSGLIAGGLLSFAIYEGFIRLIPDPAIVLIAFLIVFITTGFLARRIFMRIF